jgi:hypothetical protein
VLFDRQVGALPSYFRPMAEILLTRRLPARGDQQWKERCDKKLFHFCSFKVLGGARRLVIRRDS